jgi:predicted MFS family arabinose efflux permease
MAAALVLLAGSTLLFAFSDRLWLLFVARMLQGAADAVAWVVGFALIADLYGGEERGRAMGLVMAGSSFGVILGPFLGGWLYERGGIRLPFLLVAALAVLELIVFLAIAPRSKGAGTTIRLRKVIGHRSIVMCAVAAAAGSATFGMLEPVLPLWLESEFRLGPGSIGSLFGAAALASTLMHPFYGQLSDRWGGWRLMVTGLALSGLMLPIVSLPTGTRAAAAAMIPLWAFLSLIVTPSLAFMAEATAVAGLESYGMVYGVYNVAWAVGLMGGPSLGGFLFERVGFDFLMIGWGVGLVVLAVVLGRAGGSRPVARSFT